MIQNIVHSAKVRKLMTQGSNLSVP